MNADGRPQPPEEAPEDSELLWMWVRQAFHYGYTAAEAQRKQELLMTQVRTDVDGLQDSITAWERDVKAPMADMQARWHRTEGALKLGVPLAVVFGTIAAAVIAALINHFLGVG